jgi:hypothetical protein
MTIPATLFTLFVSSPPASARADHVAEVRHEARRQHRGTQIHLKLMRFSEAHKVAKLTSFYAAVTEQQEATFLKETTFLKDVAFLTGLASEDSVSAIPAAWMPTARCEEDGQDDPYAGYFGILEWNGFDGYPTAGSAPVSVQLAWEAAHGQGPPDAPGECHGY